MHSSQNFKLICFVFLKMRVMTQQCLQNRKLIWFKGTTNNLPGEQNLVPRNENPSLLSLGQEMKTLVLTAACITAY